MRGESAIDASYGDVVARETAQAVRGGDTNLGWPIEVRVIV
jgi:hypothetical protein